eukprot:TRINITY_DN19805_c0_g1_i1.p1 TRINITY_DN19805_c0_g1~~TRINITY_DN19805_c0_g1_i1.p1  ORF type:complete len:228 (-),score=45.36 TRINITY_DN19805_c0_g1_i1:395-1078(-)
MGDALAELESRLKSYKFKLTSTEENTLRECKDKAVKEFMFGSLIASGVTWTATSRFGFRNRLNAAGAAAMVTGIWRFRSALNSSLDHILSLDGSRLQRELATIILANHSHNPKRMQLVSKYYYVEKVFDDSNLEVPVSRWRHRNVSGDSQSFRRVEDLTNSQKASGKPQNSDSSVILGRKASDLYVDPFEFLFTEEQKCEETSLRANGKPERRHSRRHRRANRRHNP